MKRTKQVLAFFLAVFMLLSVLPTVSAAENDTPEIYLMDSQISGSYVDIGVAVKNASGLKWAEMNMQYNATLMEFQAIADSDDDSLLDGNELINTPEILLLPETGNAVFYQANNQVNETTPEESVVNFAFYVTDEINTDEPVEVLRLRFKSKAKGTVYRIELGLTCLASDGAALTATGIDAELRHRFTNRVQLKEATCSEEGLIARDCNICNRTIYLTDPTEPHTEVEDAAVAPTCTETGLTAGVHCSVCSAIVVPQETVDALGHDFDYNNGTVTVEPTYTTPGVIVYPCTRCDATESAALDTLPGFVVRYHEDADAAAEDERTTVPEGESAALLSAEDLDFVRIGYTFAGWHLTRTCDGAVYTVDGDGANAWVVPEEGGILPLGSQPALVADGAEVTGLAPTGEVHAYGVWQVNVIRMVYYGDDTPESLVVDEFVDYDSDFTVFSGSELGMEHDQHFVGWRVMRTMDNAWLAENGNGDAVWTQLEDGALPSGLSYKSLYGDMACATLASEGEVHLYAQWEPFTFHVYYHADDAAAALDTVTAVDYKSGAALPTAASLGVRHGYDVFVGWRAELNGEALALDGEGSLVWVAPEDGALPEGYTAQTLADGADVSELTREGDIHLYAQWEEGELPPLTVQTQPANQTAAVNTAASFTCAAEGADVEYRWRTRKDASSAWTYLGEAGADNGTLQVTATADLNGTQYQCVVSDLAGTKRYTAIATLTVVATLSVTQQPVGQTVVVNSAAAFTCAADGAGVKYRWRTRADAKSAWSYLGEAAAENGTLQVTAAASMNGRQYQCVISDALGNTRYSAIATLTVVSTLSVVAQPANQSAVVNSTAVFTCAAEGLDVTYHWRTRANASGAWSYLGEASADSALEVVATNALNGSQYQCVISDAVGTKRYTGIATLTVVSAVTVVKQPASQSAVVNSTAVFSCEAEGLGVTYHWRTRANASGAWSYLGEASADSALEVVATNALNGTQYQCVITDAAGTKRYTGIATLTVVPAVTVVKQPANQSAVVNSTAVFTCEAEGLGVTYHWRTRANASGAWSYLGEPSADSALEVVATDALNGTQYQCVITDAAGTKRYTGIATLTVVPAVSIVTQPASKTAVVNTTATFTCKAEGTGVTYRWRSRASAGSAWTYEGEASSSNTLQVTATDEVNGKQFQCVVTDAAGTKRYSGIATLTVIPATVIVTQPSGKTVAENATATFTCKAEGTGITYRWRTRANASSAWTNIGTAGADNGTLQVTATAALNGAQYQCVVCDASGTNRYTGIATLTVK